jgi:hypothetical protein
LAITIDTLVPLVPVLSGPTGHVTNPRPTFFWRVPRAAARYEVELIDLISGVVSTFTQTTTTFRPANPLARSDYQIRVRGISRTGLIGEFSAARTFAV